MIKIILPTVAGAFVYFIAGWVVFELVLGRFMSGHMTKAPGFFKKDDESSLVWVFISCVAYAFLLTLLFTFWTNTRTFVEGATIGAVIGSLISVMTSTYWWGTSHLFDNYKPILADIVAAGITVGLMGGVIAIASLVL
jgi:hypothetical protein